MLNPVTTTRLFIVLSISIAGPLCAWGQSDILFSGPGLGTYCAGSTIPLNYEARSLTFNAGNVLRAELSDVSGSFASPVPIGTLTTEALTGTMNVTLPPTGSGSGYRIRMVSSNPAFTGSDNGKTLTIKQPALATPTVTITGPPTICAGVSTEFTASATHGGTTPSYQWKKNGTNVGTDSPSYIDGGLVSGDAIICVLTSNRECVTTPTTNSNTIPITVTPKVAPTITIAADPSTPVGVGSVIYLSSTITGGGTAPAFQWKKNGTPFATGNAFSTTTLSNNDIITATLTTNEMCAEPLTANSNEISIAIDTNLTRSGHAWESRASQLEGGSPIVRSNASGFSIGNKGYVGLGYVMVASQMQMRKDFWEYDPLNDVWTQKADFAGVARYNAVGFTVGTKGYIGTGIAATGTRKDFWQYDPTTNSWTQRTDFPGLAREQAFGFNIGNRGYIGGGYTNGQGDFKDFYEFDPSSNTWQTKAEFGGGKRMGSATFTIENKGYVAGGYSFSTNTWFTDLWEYDQPLNVWTKRADMPGGGRTRATGFALAGNGFVGLGNSKNGYEGQFFQYNAASNTWSWKPYYPGPSGNNFGTGMSIGNRSFIFKDGKWIEYSILTVSPFSSKLCSTETIGVDWNASGFTFGTGNTFNAQISPTQNFSVATNVGTFTSSATTGTVPVNIPTSLPSGTYYFRVTSSNPVISTLTEQIVITALPPVHVITPENGATVCKGVPASFKSNLTGSGFQWYRNSDPVGTDSPDYVESNLVTGDVIKSVRTYIQGCKAPVGVASNVITMRIQAPPKPVVNVVPNTLTCSTSAVAYQWYLDDVAITNARNQTYIMLKTGKYKVRTTDNGGCLAFSDEVVNVYVGLGDEPGDEQISVYPNPAQHEFTLQLADDLVSKGANYSVINELGQTVFGIQPAERTNRVNLAGRSSGLYMVRLSLKGRTIVRRIVKVE